MAFTFQKIIRELLFYTQMVALKQLDQTFLMESIFGKILKMSLKNYKHFGIIIQKKLGVIMQ